MRSALLASILVVAVVAVACGSGDDTTAANTVPRTTPSTPSTSAPTNGAALLEPTHNAANPKPLHFDPKDAVQSAANTVLVRAWGGIAPCFVLDHYAVAETNTTVTVTLYAGSDRDKRDVACAELARRYEVAVPLHAPLGNRTLRSGA